MTKVPFNGNSQNYYNLNAEWGIRNIPDFQVNYMLYWRFHLKNEIPVNCVLIYSIEVDIYIIGFWALKVKCTQYGICGQVTFKNARTNMGAHLVYISRVTRPNGRPWAQNVGLCRSKSEWTGIKFLIGSKNNMDFFWGAGPARIYLPRNARITSVIKFLTGTLKSGFSSCEVEYIMYFSHAPKFFLCRLAGY